MAEKILRDITIGQDIHKPEKCTQCGCVDIEYLGLGEYKCKDCLIIMYDDYGKVRHYVEEHRGATEIDVSMATGVSRETIRHFIRDERFEVINGRYSSDS